MSILGTSKVEKLIDEGDSTLNPGGEAKGDPTISQTVDDVRRKAEQIRLNKDGTVRKKRDPKKLNDSVPAGNSAGLGQPGFTEPQVKATFQGLFSVTALATNCNVWFLSDDEANCFVPSSTLALNQTFPAVASSKWGAISLASLSLMAVVTAKTLLYFQYKQNLKAERAKNINPLPPTENGTNAT